MAQVTRAAGICYVKLDGGQLQLDGDLKIKWGGEVRSMKGNPDRTVSVTSKFEHAEVELTLRERADVTMDQLKAIVGATVTIELEIGTVIVLGDCFQIDDLTLDAIEGKLPIKFGGTQRPVEFAA